MSSTRQKCNLTIFVKDHTLEEEGDKFMRYDVIKMACSGLLLVVGLTGCAVSPVGESKNQGSNISSSDSVNISHNENSEKDSSNNGSLSTSSSKKVSDTPTSSSEAPEDNEAVILQPAPIFSDGMVIQRDKPISIWGQGTKNKTVKVSLFQGNTAVETKKQP